MPAKGTARDRICPIDGAEFRAGITTSCLRHSFARRDFVARGSVQRDGKGDEGGGGGLAGALGFAMVN